MGLKLTNGRSRITCSSHQARQVPLFVLFLPTVCDSIINKNFNWNSNKKKGGWIWPVDRSVNIQKVLSDPG